MPEIQLPGSGVGSAQWWKTQLDWSAENRKDLLPTWRYAMNAYRDELEKTRPEAIRVNIEFEKTEQKKPLLFYRLPKIKLKPHPRTLREALQQTPEADPRVVLRKAVAIFEEVLAYHIGPKRANLKAAMDEVLMDVLCPAGIGFVKIGYAAYEDGKIPVPTGRMQPDPTYQPPPGSVLGLVPRAPLVPVMGQAPNVVAERYFAARISPAKALIPTDFDASDYNEADWLGDDFWMTGEEAKTRNWSIPSEARPGGEDDDFRIVPLKRKGHRSADQFHFREVFCWASRIYPDREVNPEKIYRLLFVEGSVDPILIEPFRHQRFDARRRLVAGLRRLPIRALTLRYFSDYCYPPSDCRVTKQQGDELSEFRTQMIIHRRKAVPMRTMDIHGLIDENVKALVKKGEYYEIIPTDGPGDKIFNEIARPTYPRENYTGNDYVMNDVNRMWGLGMNQSSTRESAGTTATEIATIRQATESRTGSERGKVVDEFLISIIEDIGTLIQLYADREDFVEIVGEDGTRSIESWNRDTIKGEFLYSVVPNSAALPDAAADRDLALNRYNLLANDPFTNREQLVRDTYEAFEADPDRLVRVPEPPPPEKPRVTLSIKGDDLNPMVPQYQNVVNMLIASGVPATLQPPSGEPTGEPTEPAKVVDRERLRMAEADEADQRAGGLVGV